MNSDFELSSVPSPVRKSNEEILNQIRIIENSPQNFQLFNSVPDLVLIVNKERQIVFVNDAMLRFLQITDRNEVFGRRFGEALSCINSGLSVNGCGHSEQCLSCGALKAVAMSQVGKEASEEFTMNRGEGIETIEFKVISAPLAIDEGEFYSFVVTDVSNEKRRRALERIFFHDILNTAGGLKGFADLLTHSEEEDLEYLTGIISKVSGSLIEEIIAQRDLSAAENNELVVKTQTVDVFKIIHEVYDIYRNHSVTKGKSIIIEHQEDERSIVTDPVLLRRVLGNMLKNALEATEIGGSVIVGYSFSSQSVMFYVKNKSVMPKKIRDQVFKRSFSTKGADRGLGTYSMKLLTEKYLHGEMHFESVDEKGTTFYANIPNVLIAEFQENL